MKNISLVEAKFIRSKLKSISTTLWDSTDNLVKETIIDKVRFELNEKPIICYFKKSSYWWILTNVSLIICNNNCIANYQLSNIHTVELNDLFDGIVKKKECSNLQLYINGQRIDLELENGTWPILYDIFKFITRH